MIRGSIDRPARIYGTTDQKCQQLYDYLYSLADQLQDIFDSIGDDDAAITDIKKRVTTLEQTAGLSRRTIPG